MRRQIFFLVILIYLLDSPVSLLRSQTPDEATLRASPQEAYDVSRVYRQVTTHPDIDSYPAISPDGRWLAFSSRRSGNMDIWIKPIQGGSAIQVTSHRTDDIMPAWSPDGEQLVYVSYQDDAAGDIWIVSLRKRGDEFAVKGNPAKLTDYLGQDISPAFSPDGRFIAFASNRDGRQNVYVLQLSNNKIFQITKTGGLSPTWSPDGKRIAFVATAENQSHFGQIFYARLSFKSKIPQVAEIVQLTRSQSKEAFPSWNPLKNEIVFNRYNRDTNLDGFITPDDQPSLWKIIIEQDSTIESSRELESTSEAEPHHYHHEFELMPSFSLDYFPVCGKDGRVYFISRRSGNEDVWSIPTEGIIPRMENAFLQYQFASNYFPLAYTDLVFKQTADSTFAIELEQRLLAFSRVNDFFPQEFYWIGWSLYEIAKTYKTIGNSALATAYFEEVLAQFKPFPKLAGETELRLFELAFDPTPEKLNSQVDQLNSVIDRFQDQPQVLVQAQLLLGEVYFLHGRYSQALKSLELLIDNYPDQEERCALAQFLIGEIYKKFGQTEDVMNAYLQVIQNYPGQEAWVDSSLTRILDLQGSEDFATRLSAYRNIIARYGQYRRLAARAQLKNGEAFYQASDFEAAESELPLVFMTYPDQRIEVARTKLLLAKIYIQKGDEVRAIAEYKKIIDEFGDVLGGLFVVQAKEELLSIYLESGKRFRLGADLNAAYARYRDAVKMLPRDIEANRGMIASMYSLGLIDNALKMYQNLITQYPRDEIYLYMLGLCYSYKATEQSDRTKNIENFDPILMKSSIETIRAALSKNYRLIQAYLTLSYNYEFMENYENAIRAKKQSFFTAAVKTIVAPVKTLVYLITFQKEKMPGQWYEQAIDALTAAITLNDERQNPQLESEIALNLANNYYNLKEFGFERAYHYYQQRLKYDTTFVSLNTAARIYKQMGHCAMVVEDFNNGPKYLKKAAKLYQDLGDEENWLLNIKRLALIYQIKGESDNYDISNDYFLQATKEDEARKRYNQLLSGYRNIAFNFQLLNDEEEALRYANKALDLIREEKVTRVKAKPNWIKIGILGVEFPVWNLGLIGAGFSTAAEGFTTDEETALLYTIMGQAKYGQKSIPGAIDYINKKIEIYHKRKDKIAEAIFLNNIGYLYYLDEDYKKAWEYFEKSFKICKSEQNIPGMLTNVLNLSQVGAGINRLQLLPPTFVPDSSLAKLLNEAPQFLTSSYEYARYGLSLYGSEVTGYLKEKAQIYHVLGNLHFLDKLFTPDSLKNNYPHSTRQTMQRFEHLAIADSCYRAALKISIENNFKADQIIAYQNLGQVSLALGDWDNAIIEFTYARNLAIERNLLSQLWQINFALGNIYTIYHDSSQNRPGKKDANFYFNEAINTIEQMIFESSESQNSPLYRFQVRMLYQDVIDFSIANNRMINALRLTEQFRGKTYLDFISNHRLELKKELHKIFYGNAKQSIKDINEKSAEVLSEKEKEEPSQSKIIELLQQKRKLIRDYRSLIDEVKQEDPELESFVSVEPVTYVQLQKMLDKNTIVLNYFISKEKTYLWTISADSIGFFMLSAPGDTIDFYTKQLLATITTNQDFGAAAQWLWKNLFQPITADIARAKKVIIIPDGAMNRLPFSFLINSAIGEGI
ncbi:MAG TPA: tetratricopeptide repeat protein, partial [bacterium]